MTRRSYVIGRSPYADVVLADPGIAGRHAEIVATSDGRYHVTDCASETGTWHRADPEGDWESVRQAFVGPDDELRLGELACTVRSLLGDQLSPRGGQGSAKGRWRHEGLGAGHAAEPQRGRVERDPETGEIVPKRI